MFLSFRSNSWFVFQSSGALKIKELTYMHSEGIQGGELKHGTLAMVDEKRPIGMVIMKDGVYKKSMNALQQVWLQYTGCPTDMFTALD